MPCASGGTQLETRFGVELGQHHGGHVVDQPRQLLEPDDRTDHRLHRSGPDEVDDVRSDPLTQRGFTQIPNAILKSNQISAGGKLAYAMLLHSPWLGRGVTLFKIAIFLPVVTPDVAGYVVWRWLFDQSFGAVNTALGALSMPTFGGLASTDTVIWAVLIAELWHHVGFYVVIFLANLALCDRGVREAAQIDGAGAWQTFCHVTLPELRPALLVNSVYALIQYLKTFTVVAVMTKGGPNDSTNFVSYYAYQLFEQGRYGEATAMASILFAIVIALALGLMMIQRGSVSR